MEGNALRAIDHIGREILITQANDPLRELTAE